MKFVPEIAKRQSFGKTFCVIFVTRKVSAIKVIYVFDKMSNFPN